MTKYIEQPDGTLIEAPGEAALWEWFGLSRATWCVLPRVLMHAMSDEWQAKMAELLKEYANEWDFPDDTPEAYVTLRKNGRITMAPDWLAYRHPDEAFIESMRRKDTP